jgi:hypothetical protein
MPGPALCSTLSSTVHRPFSKTVHQPLPTIEYLLLINQLLSIIHAPLPCLDKAAHSHHMLAITMSTEAQPPSPPDWSASRANKDKLSKSPPMAFNIRSARRGHIRSSSFGDFVSRLLPSRRQEKGHTLRSEYNDDSTQEVAIGLVSDAAHALSRKGFPDPEITDGGARGTCPRKKDMNDAQTACSVDSRSLHGLPGSRKPSAVSDEIRDRELPSQDEQPGGGEIRGASGMGERRKVNTFKKIFGSLRRLKEGKGRGRWNSEPLLSQSAQVLENGGPHIGGRNVHLEDKPITKTQQIFDVKRSQREQRRSLRESGDFLGVQGANPRTGYWDISDATSSSEPSQMSENTKLKLVQQERELAEQRKQYEKAQMLHEEDLIRIQNSKELKKKEKEGQKKLELRTRQRRRGKWRVSENGWSSVAEPDLSPIQQSVAGSPVAGKSIRYVRSTIADQCTQNLLLAIDSFRCLAPRIRAHT